MEVQNIYNGVVGENRGTGVSPLKFSTRLVIFDISLEYTSVINFQSKITWRPLAIPRQEDHKHQ